MFVMSNTLNDLS